PELRQAAMKIDTRLRIGVGPGGVVNTKRRIRLDLPLQTSRGMKIDFSAWHADSVRPRDVDFSGTGQRLTMGHSWRRENFGSTAHDTLPTAALPASGSTRRRLVLFRRAGVSAAVLSSLDRSAGSEDSQPSDPRDGVAELGVGSPVSRESVLLFGGDAAQVAPRGTQIRTCIARIGRVRGH